MKTLMTVFALVVTLTSVSSYAQFATAVAGRAAPARAALVATPLVKTAGNVNAVIYNTKSLSSLACPAPTSCSFCPASACSPSAANCTGCTFLF